MANGNGVGFGLFDKAADGEKDRGSLALCQLTKRCSETYHARMEPIGEKSSSAMNVLAVIGYSDSIEIDRQFPELVCNFVTTHWKTVTRGDGGGTQGR